MRVKKHITVLTGAGVSAESGIQTFRDSNGLWEGHDVMEVASPQGFSNNPALVLEFYNERRRQLKQVHPNAAHIAIAEMEEVFDVTVITQNVDDLHEKAGSSHIIHLHGELTKASSSGDSTYIKIWDGTISLSDKCPKGFQMRPFIVWFGEAVPMLERAIEEVAQCDAIIIIGTSMQVYPAASLTSYAPPNVPICYVDPNPNINYELSRSSRLQVFKGPATSETKNAIQFLKDLYQI